MSRAGSILAGLSILAGSIALSSCRDNHGIGGIRADAGADASLYKDSRVPDVLVDAASTDGSEPGDADLLDSALLDAALPDSTLSDAGHADAHIDGALFDGGVITCPLDMVAINNQFCIDIYEASRPDATDTFDGTDNSRATSRPNVVPWYTAPWKDPVHITLADARAACQAAGKRLCLPAEWEAACMGTQSTVYGYGNLYDPVMCNGIDTYCRCGAGSPCENTSPCPYAHCFHLPPQGETEPASGCGSAWRIDVTGFFPGCLSDFGAHDMNGNVWELVDTSDGLTHYRGGACNCINSELLHQCGRDTVASSSSPNVRGFRCCLTP